ncbi:MAG: asparaginase [Firmicutes bacterium]|nr:asparaginase [Bacillota bacterium]
MKHEISNLPVVYILATGGTIAGRAASPVQTGGYRAGELGVEDLTAAIPGLNQIAQIRSEQICNVASPAITIDIWLQLARRINEILHRQPEVAGVVITHGTDSLEETAYFLNLVVKSNKPVVVVGSMRPATSISPDGPMNLVNAIHVAAAPEARGKGVLVVMNDEIFAARDVSKTHVSQLHTFRSYDLGALGNISNGVVSFYRQPLRCHTASTEFSVEGLPTLPRVDIVYSYLGADGALVDAAVAAGARGIVLAGMGQGGTTRSQGEALARAGQQGVFVVRASRTGTGRILPPRPEWIERGAAITADNLIPQKARILLMLALTKTNNPQEIQRMFNSY